MSQMLDASQVQLVYAKCIPGSLDEKLEVAMKVSTTGMTRKGA